MDYMKIPSQEKCWAHYIYSCNIYRYLFEGAPSISLGVEGVHHLKAMTQFLSPCIEYFIYEHLRVGKEILPYRGNVAYIDNAYRRSVIIWLDRGEMDARERLAQIIDEVGFNCITKEYFF